MLHLSLSSPLSLYSIPAIWFTAFYPGTLKFLLIDKTIGYDNTLPRTNVALAQGNKRLPSSTAAKIARMEGAHCNGYENFPLWIAAIMTANLAGLDHYTLNVASLWYFGLRLLYNHVYINHNTFMGGWFRTLVYFTALPIPLWLLVKSANKIADAA